MDGDCIPICDDINFHYCDLMYNEVLSLMQEHRFCFYGGLYFYNKSGILVGVNEPSKPSRPYSVESHVVI